MQEQIIALLNNPYIFTVFLLWVLTWKGFALWKAARNSSRNWFVAILVLNTIGILEILYIFVFSKKKGQTQSIQN